MSRRRGTSLVESVVVISLVSLVLALSATMLIASFRAHERAVAREDLQRSFARLARRLRTDAHAASSAEMLPDKDAAGVRLSLPEGRTIAYEAGRGEVVRTVRRDEAVEHRDVFALAGFDAKLSLAPADQSAKQDAALVVVDFQSRQEHPTSHAAQLLPLEAAVGLVPRDVSEESDK